MTAAISLKKRPICYLTRDLERAMGLALTEPGYFIVTNQSQFAKSAAKGRKNALLIKGKKILDTRELLNHPRTIKFINKLKTPGILVFKNTPQIEKICLARGWNLLNPSAALANRVEEKISQLEWLGPLKKYLPPHQVMLGKNLRFKKTPFIAQFNRAHTGTGTILIESHEQIEELKKKFPNRETRVTEFVPGPAFTVNAIVWKNKVPVGNISYQITGLKPFTDQQFATIGNDWALANKVLSTKQISTTRRIATSVGKRLARGGWKGLFGIDVIAEEKTGKIFLIEINARQPASATYESQLQNAQRGTRNVEGVTTFEAHLAALLGLPTSDLRLQPITDGAQIIQRVPPATLFPLARGVTPLDGGGLRGETERMIKKLQRNKITLIPYPNIEPGQDLLRIQSKKGIMKKHNEFNDLGKNIKNQII